MQIMDGIRKANNHRWPHTKPTNSLLRFLSGLLQCLKPDIVEDVYYMTKGLDSLSMLSVISSYILTLMNISIASFLTSFDTIVL